MTGPSVQKTVSRGVAWVSLAASVVAVCDLISLAVILRLWATAEDYGTASAVMTMFGAIQLVGEGGIPAAIVQRTRGADERLSSAYFVGLVAGCVIYAVIWLVAPAVGAAFEQPVISDVLRVAGLLVLIRPFYTTHQATLRRDLRFRELSIVRVIANLAELAAKLTAAWAGSGVWCFVIGPLVREAIYAVGVPLIAGWRPTWRFHPRELVSDLRFGMRSSGAELLFQVYSNFDYQVVGYSFGLTALGFYRAAYELVLEPVRFVSGVVTTVAFPAFSRLREDRALLTEQLLAFTRQNLAVVGVFVATIVVTADDVLHLTYGPAYVTAAGAARVLAVVGALRALSFLGPPLLDGTGRSDLSLRYQAIAATVLSLAFVLATHLGTTSNAIAAAWALGYPIAFSVLAWMVLRQLGITARAYLRRIARLALIPVVAACAGALVRLAVVDQAPAVRLVVAGGVVVGICLAGLVLLEGFSPRAIAGRLR